MADKKTPAALSTPPTIALPSTTSPAATPTIAPTQKPTKDSKPKDSKPKDPKSKDSKPAREPKPAKDAKPQPLASTATDGPKLTAKQLKEQKKAEKAARRADTKAATGIPSLQQTGSHKTEKNPPPATQATTVIATTGGGIVKTIYPTNPAAIVVKEVEVVVETGRDNGLVGLLKNLAVEQQDKKKAAVFGIGNAHPDVHPAILTLGMQINQYVLAGSAARCLGFLLAMKRVIHDYTTPPASTLTRHLPGHYLSHQIAYLLSARPMSTAMGNTIRWLKTTISELSPDLTEEAAKNELAAKIDVFIREKIALADDLIVNTTVARYIQDGAIIVTYGKSQVVERALLEARRRGRRFRVVVIDSRPLLEGANMLAGLAQAGINCEYACLDALDYCVGPATTVLLGAHAVLADGAVYSRAGTAAVAACARDMGVPVVVACESVKFSDKINLDGIVFNELGDPELLVTMSDSDKKERGPLSGWRDVENTYVASFRYDVTPSDYVKMIICEHGCVAPNSVASVLRTAAV